MPTDQQIISTIQQEARDFHYLRHGFERDWYRNLLYRQGHQWIVWDGVGRRFRQKKIKSWIPMPVTNKFASVLDALVALLLRVEPTMQWRALDPNDEAAKSRAETASKLIDRAKEITQFRHWRHEVANWMVYTGQAYLFSYYDPDGGGELRVPYYRCDTCAHENLPASFEDGCPQCGQRATSVAVDAQGVPREEVFTAGALRTEVASPFETLMDFGVYGWHHQSRVLRVKDRPLTYFQRYGAKGQAVPASKSQTLSEFYQHALAHMSSGSSAGASTFASTRVPTGTEYYYLRKPDDDYPDGLMAIVGGDQLLVKEPLTYRDQNGQPLLPVSQFLFDPIPGSAAGKTVANDLAPKQKQRNELESLIQLITMRSANPVWIVPYGTDVEGFSGQPGAVLKSIQLSPSANSEPRRLPGENIPGSIMAWLEKIDSDMEEMASVFDVMKGNAPPGVTAGYALQLLIERGQSRWGPLFQRWENGMTAWATHATMLLRDYMPSEQLLEVLGPFGEWDLAQFKSEPMKTLALVVEAGSNRPTSALSEQAIVDNLIAKGLIDLHDPGNRAEILRSVGMSKYDHVSDWDIKDAAREEEAFLSIAKSYDLGGLYAQLQQVAPVDPLRAQALQQHIAMLTQSATRFRPQIDHNALHLWSHKKFAKTDAYLKLSAEWQAVWMQHIEAHALRVMQEAQQLAGVAGPSGPGTPPPAGPSPSPPAPGQPPVGQASSYMAASPKGGHIQNPVMAGGGH